MRHDSKDMFFVTVCCRCTPTSRDSAFSTSRSFLKHSPRLLHHRRLIVNLILKHRPASNIAIALQRTSMTRSLSVSIHFLFLRGESTREFSFLPAQCNVTREFGFRQSVPSAIWAAVILRNVDASCGIPTVASRPVFPIHTYLKKLVVIMLACPKCT